MNEWKDSLFIILHYVFRLYVLVWCWCYCVASHLQSRFNLLQDVRVVWNWKWLISLPLCLCLCIVFDTCLFVCICSYLCLSFYWPCVCGYGWVSVWVWVCASLFLFVFFCLSVDVCLFVSVFLWVCVRNSSATHLYRDHYTCKGCLSCPLRWPGRLRFRNALFDRFHQGKIGGIYPNKNLLFICAINQGVFLKHPDAENLFPCSWIFRFCSLFTFRLRYQTIVVVIRAKISHIFCTRNPTLATNQNLPVTRAGTKSWHRLFGQVQLRGQIIFFSHKFYPGDLSF